MLQVRSLSCRRGKRQVFRDLDFALPAGSILMVTGANGSGKSSLLRMLAGLLPAQEGNIRWQERDIAEDPEIYSSALHYIGHHDCVKPELTVAEHLSYWRTLFGVASLAEDIFGIRPLYERPARYLSAGQKRRLALSRLLLGNRPLWLLDEPATTLDRQGQGILMDCIMQHRTSGGITVIAAHHDMEFPDVMHCELNGEIV